ncbi:hypothetical protein [Pedobacter sp. UYP1]|uniref:hypothetical protein n=1 Tax=Pedobacter sp. UYP1 TaxID=1756396 RepID=UPI003390C001
MNLIQPSRPVLAFIKYGTEEHMKALQNGKLFFNTLQFFAGCDPSIGRGDQYENIYKQTYGIGATMDLTREFHDVHITMTRLPDGTFRSTYVNTEFFANIFCLYSVISEQELKDQNHQLSLEMTGFGTHMLIIFKPHEFIARVERIIPHAVKNFHRNGVRYIDANVLNGRKEYFEKPLRYKYQNEYRLAYQNNKEETSVFEIGSIADISVIMPVDKCKGLQFFTKQNDLVGNLEALFTQHLTEYNASFDAYQAFINKGFLVDQKELNQLKSQVEKTSQEMTEFLNSIMYST